MSTWNDDRLDDLSRRTDEGFKEMRTGFARVDREMKEGFARVDREMKEGFAAERGERNRQFAELGARLDRLQYLILFTLASLVVTLVAERF